MYKSLYCNLNSSRVVMERVISAHGYFYFKIIPNEYVHAMSMKVFNESMTVKDTNFIINNTNEIVDFINKFKDGNLLCYKMMNGDMDKFKRYPDTCDIRNVDVDFQNNKLFLFAGFGLNHTMGNELIYTNGFNFGSEEEYMCGFNFKFSFKFPENHNKTFFISYDINVSVCSILVILF